MQTAPLKTMSLPRVSLLRILQGFIYSLGKCFLLAAAHCGVRWRHPHRQSTHRFCSTAQRLAGEILSSLHALLNTKYNKCILEEGTEGRMEELTVLVRS